MKNRNNKIIWFVIILFVIFLVSFIYARYVDSESVIRIIQNSNIAPVIYILFVAGQVLLFPIPGQFTGIAGGYFFGYILGTFYSIIGLTIGSYIAFYLARKFGKPLVEKIDKKDKIKHFERLIKNKEEPILFLVLLLPFMPDDLISFIAGLTKIRTSNFILITIIGRLPGFFFLNLVGAGLSESGSKFIFLMAFIVIASIILFLYRNSLEKYFMSLIERQKNKHNIKITK